MGKASSLINIIRQERDILKLRKLNIDSPISISNEINILNELSKALKTHSTFEIYKNGCKYVGWKCGCGLGVWSVGVCVGVECGSGSVGWECGCGSVGVGVGVWCVCECGSAGWECGSGSVGWECGIVGVGVWECVWVWECESVGPFRFSLYLGLFLLGPLLYIQILYSLVPYITDLEK
ncbi:hypothetical protein RhiirA1_395119 [Rhizophagus irregularis]|uniref:Uncharacterized protein n=1 Tax=Rhizophagus irregularis TaxID=588596 RepID=A0A2I1EKV4_9GLOM|nr:hypothetical protein RhiirA1_395119 [Rhizophagus irregularis]PKY22758.1 hypothetical protein RhiirB3_503953 [Rhizophagus irregularis]